MPGSNLWTRASSVPAPQPSCRLPRTCGARDGFAGLLGLAHEFAVALQADDDGAHLVALGEDDFVEHALIERVQQAGELSHRLTDGRKLVIGDPDALSRFVHGVGRYGQGRTDGRCFVASPSAEPATL